MLNAIAIPAKVELDFLVLFLDTLLEGEQKLGVGVFDWHICDYAFIPLLLGFLWDMMLLEGIFSCICRYQDKARVVLRQGANPT